MEKLLEEITAAIMERWPTAAVFAEKNSTSSDIIKEYIISEDRSWLISVENRAGRGYGVVCSRNESAEGLPVFNNKQHPKTFQVEPERSFFLEYYIEKDFFSEGYKTHFYKNKQINSVIWSIDNLIKNLEVDFREYEKQYA